MARTTRSPGEADALGLLGLARRAGATTLGVEATRAGVRAGEVALVIVAEDASLNRSERVRRLAEHRRVPVRWVSGQVPLGSAVGGGPVSAVGITTPSFVQQLLRTLPSSPPEAPEGGGSRKGQEEPSPDAGC